MSSGKKKITVIPAEKMALLAEKGLNNARLSRAEKIALAEGGLAEFYTIKKDLKTPVPPIDQQLIQNIMSAHFSSKQQCKLEKQLKEISVQLTSSAIRVMRNAPEWQFDSPLFAKRGDESDSISFFKTSGKYSVHFEITMDSEQRACIAVILINSLKREQSFEAALFQDEQCVESIHVSKNPLALFSGIIPGLYSLKVSYYKSEIVTVNIRLEK